jgi:glycosyltransferase involved in cell wall biosynthesis
MAIRTALLTNFVAPYRLKLLEALRDRVGELKIFVSTLTEADRPWAPNMGSLYVVQQKTKTFKRTRMLPDGYHQRLFIHFPYDTLPQLWRYSPAIVISGELGLRSLQAAIYRRLMRRSRLIVWATLSEVTEKGWGLGRRILRRIILSTADAVMCNGKSGSRYIASLGFPPDRIYILNQPIDVAMFASLPEARAPEDSRRLVFSGRLIPQKAVVELQSVLADWARANPARQLELIWIGDGELRATLEQVTLPANFSQFFHGNQPYEALPELYRHCGALVLPSLMDEWGLVVNEAMASGMVVLGSVYSQAAIEMVEDGKNGWLIDPLHPETIVAAMDKLFTTPIEKLQEMRLAARERALRLTPESGAEVICTVIANVRSGKPNNKPAPSVVGPPIMVGQPGEAAASANTRRAPEPR